MPILLGLLGPYISWSLTGWFPTDKLAAKISSDENGAQFALIVGARLGQHVAVETFMAPPLNSDQPTIDVHGVDAEAAVAAREICHAVRTAAASRG